MKKCVVKKNEAERVLDWLDGINTNQMLIGVIVGLMIEHPDTREQTKDRLLNWISRVSASEALEEAASCGFEATLSMLIAAIRVPQNRACILNRLAQHHGQTRVMAEFFGQLSDRDKLLLSTFDSFLAALESRQQDAIRAAVDSFDLTNIPAEYQFLLGVKYASEGVSAA